MIYFSKKKCKTAKEYIRDCQLFFCIPEKEIDYIPMEYNPRLSVEKAISKITKTKLSTLSLLELFDLQMVASRKISELSKLYTKKVELAMSLARSPKAIVLVEPFVGLDEKASLSLGKDLIFISEKGIKVSIYSAQYLPENIERLLSEHYRIKDGEQCLI